ncbi:PREDICTED: linker for activation of T-cells family member 2 [Pterocles gutturalis]|uniref:linker for activation of T-cells family member 2 n=1 Tax=Pterocles gutturalis TaxID=240206 RepID=UPI0005287551|nr:PREDICTED: linker for activation of T-cells family member 2 [Pterocles gutturalis]
MAQLELLWAAAALMLLGAIVSLCVKCQLSATKRAKQPSERSSQFESQQGFEVIRSHSSEYDRCAGLLPCGVGVLHAQNGGSDCVLLATISMEAKEIAVAVHNRKTTEEFSASCRAGYGSRTESRYRNFLTEDYLRGDAAYVEPISLDYYNCARFFTPPIEKEEDSHSYQNVINGVSHGSDTDDALDYENSAAIHFWKLQQAEALQPDSLDEEPDYVNTAPVSGPAPLAKPRSQYR